MSQTSWLSALSMAALIAPGTVAAEGGSEVGANQGLQNSTTLYVDVLDHASESIGWKGDGTLSVYNPDGDQ